MSRNHVGDEVLLGTSEKHPKAVPKAKGEKTI